ncbi:MAG: NAD(P)-dependent oxidoreductase, partial [Tistlia sp.]
MSDKQRIGFVGVGLMGHGMAKHLHGAGHPLTILGHRNRKPVDDLVGRGAKEAKTPAEVARASDIVFLCLPTSDHVEAIVAGPDGLLEGAAEGMIVVDTSTADPSSTLRLGEIAAARGVHLVDAPLTRTPKEAEEGKLNTMVGCDETLFATLKPVMACYAENVFHVGPLGAGHKLKLINNFMAMGLASLVAEAVTAARTVGVDLVRLNELVSAGPVNSGIFQKMMAQAIDGDPSGLQFAIRNARKDLRYFNNMASEAGLFGAMAPAALQTLTLAVGLGHGEERV